jgi:hypothetical protein
MKAEWCLWEGYSKWDIGLNPFLGHFVEVWDARFTSPQVGGDTLVVGIILSGQAKEVYTRLYWRGLTVVIEYDCRGGVEEGAWVGGIGFGDIDPYFTARVIATTIRAHSSTVLKVTYDDDTDS